MVNKLSFLPVRWKWHGVLFTDESYTNLLEVRSAPQLTTWFLSFRQHKLLHQSNWSTMEKFAPLTWWINLYTWNSAGDWNKSKSYAECQCLKLELVRVDYQYLPLILQQRSVLALQVVSVSSEKCSAAPALILPSLSTFTIHSCCLVSCQFFTIFRFLEQ